MTRHRLIRCSLSGLVSCATKRHHVAETDTETGAGDGAGQPVGIEVEGGAADDRRGREIQPVARADLIFGELRIDAADEEGLSIARVPVERSGRADPLTIKGIFRIFDIVGHAAAGEQPVFGVEQARQQKNPLEVRVAARPQQAQEFARRKPRGEVVLEPDEFVQRPAQIRERLIRVRVVTFFSPQDGVAQPLLLSRQKVVFLRHGLF